MILSFVGTELNITARSILRGFQESKKFTSPNVLSTSLPCCAARWNVFICRPPSRPVVQPAGTYFCAAPRPALCSPLFSATLRRALLCSLPFSAGLRRALSCSRPARPIVQPVGSLCCAGRPMCSLQARLFWPALLCGPPKIYVFQLGTRPSSPLGPPALRLVSSFIIV